MTAPEAPHDCAKSEPWFDRSICPQPCSAMHNRCGVCGAALDWCPYEKGHVEKLSWRDRLLLCNSFTFWAGANLIYVWCRFVRDPYRRAYDGLMIRFWPYDRWPEEWRSLLRRR